MTLTRSRTLTSTRVSRLVDTPSMPRTENPGCESAKDHTVRPVHYESNNDIYVSQLAKYANLKALLVRV